MDDLNYNLLKSKYEKDGFLIVRNVLSINLINELRILSLRCRDIARKLSGENTQRLQPIYKYLNKEENFLFDEYRKHKNISEIISNILTEEHYLSRDYLGIFFNPETEAYCTPWHRDGRDNQPGLDLQKWSEHRNNLNYFNQINLALYPDDSTWYVTGSHNRLDTPEEMNLFPTRPIMVDFLREDQHRWKDPSRKNSKDSRIVSKFSGKIGKLTRLFKNKVKVINDFELEYNISNYCKIIPNSVNVSLNPGDMLLYRNCGWHLGAYTPHKRRATLHDIPMTNVYKDWISISNKNIKKASSTGSLSYGNASKY
jgi:ectoine hydroxylase-related dioxygenase (phytanoyl-CoA dioxygenase family)